MGIPWANRIRLRGPLPPDVDAPSLASKTIGNTLLLIQKAGKRVFGFLGKSGQNGLRQGGLKCFLSELGWVLVTKKLQKLEGRHH